MQGGPLPSRGWPLMSSRQVSVGTLVDLLVPAPLPLGEMWAEQDEGAATLGAYETTEGKVGGRTAPFCVFRAGLRRKGLGEEAVAQISGGQQDVPSEDKRVEELQGENPFCLGKGPGGEQSSLPLPHCVLCSGHPSCLGLPRGPPCFRPASVFPLRPSLLCFP